MPRRRRISASRESALLGAQLLHPGGDGGLVGRIGIELGEELIPGVVVELTVELQHLQQARILRPQPRQFRGNDRGNLSHAHTI
jgi:hypothetical protein